MQHPTRTPLIAASLLTILAATGCGSGASTGDNAQGPEETGQVIIALTSTPVANTCLVLSYTGTTATTYTLYATAATSTSSVAV